MKTNSRSWTKALAVLVSMAALTVTIQAASIAYDNSTTSLGVFYGTTNEFGDQIKLAGNPLERNITTFKFEYYLAHGASGDERGILRLYDNTGQQGSPGTLLFQSDLFSLRPGYNTMVGDGLNIFAPSDNITWTVEFSGVTGNEIVGLTFYDPPTVGSSFDDFWEKTGDTWVLKRFSADVDGTISNFGAQVTAVPEPSTIALGLLGAAALLLRRRK
jgi:hypothetical protein